MAKKKEEKISAAQAAAIGLKFAVGEIKLTGALMTKVDDEPDKLVVCGKLRHCGADFDVVMVAPAAPFARTLDKIDKVLKGKVT